MLPPDFKLDKITDLKLLKVVKTLMKYGAYVVDRNDNSPFVIYVENGANNTYTQALEWGPTTVVLRQISYFRWGMSKVKDNIPSAPQRYKLSMEATGGVKLSMSTTANDQPWVTAKLLGNAESEIVLWPDKGNYYCSSPIPGTAALGASAAAAATAARRLPLRRLRPRHFTGVAGAVQRRQQLRRRNQQRIMQDRADLAGCIDLHIRHARQLAQGAGRVGAIAGLLGGIQGKSARIHGNPHGVKKSVSLLNM